MARNNHESFTGNFEPPEVDLPPLFRVKDVTDYLDISRSQLQNLMPHLLRLELPGPTQPIRGFSRDYITAFGNHLANDFRIKHVPPAQRFARTPEAHAYIADARDYLADMVDLNSEGAGYIKANHAARILNIGRMTVTDWKNRYDQREPGGVPVMPLRPGVRNLYIPDYVMHSMLLNWQYPQEYDPTAAAPEIPVESL